MPVFNEQLYTVNTMEIDGQTLRYRAFENIPYAAHPVDAKLQVMHIFAPEIYFEGGSVGPYSLHTAPIFLPNTVGGYMPGPADHPGRDFRGAPNSIFQALVHGYVVASPGLRGREMQNEAGKFLGTAPAVIVDYKAAVRFLHRNAASIPGDAEKIISNGTSAGGAISALLGASGNHPDYAPYLAALGAADARDDIFAASCYCPITNLDHADMAYEWEFNGINDFHRMRMIPPQHEGERPQFVPFDGEMTAEQRELSDGLKPLFQDYVNSLQLLDENGMPLTLNADGTGTLCGAICRLVLASAQKELDAGRDLSAFDWLTVENGRAAAVDFKAYIAFRTRMKTAPAFDNTAFGTPENELFGTADTKYRHFTAFSAAHSSVNGELADEDQIRMMNPMPYIGDARSTTARYYRIRHGSVDRDTSLAIPTLLAAKLRCAGTDTDLAFPWGIPHAGDYDLPELFAWIDTICAK
ncbi:MAG: subtype B tannase [Hominenteromicrobium sp.]